jgi:predicted nucleotidyltransferase
MSLPGAVAHDGSTAGPEVLAAVLSDAVRALAGAGVRFALIGGLASASWGRPRCSSDIDLLLDARDAALALAALSDAGFRTEETNPIWLFKAFRDDILVDLLFKSKGEIYLDDEMQKRVQLRSVHGEPMPVLAPEDLIVMKALAHDEEAPRHWFDALALVACCSLDWGYLLARARKGPLRLLSLVAYASSLGLAVPDGVLPALHALCRGEGAERMSGS